MSLGSAVVNESSIQTSSLAAHARAPLARPITFESAHGDLFGWYHQAAAPARDACVVLCAPVGFEGIYAYSTYARLAERLAAAGFPVLRFDYHGTGDSTGHDLQPQRVAAWVASIHAAVAELRAMCGVPRVALVATRFGANLAVQAASEAGGYEALIMVGATSNGRGYARELRAYNMLKEKNGAEAPRAKDAKEDYIEAAGFAFTESTLADMARLDLGKLQNAPAAAALFIPRDDMPVDERTPAHFRSLGVETDVREAAGYAAMMRESHLSQVPEPILRTIEDWLTQRYPQRTRTEHLAHARRTQLSADDVLEQSAFFGDSVELFGILSAPPATAPVRDTAVLMLNVGTNHRVGPNRMYVTMARDWARRGYPCLRFDLAGMGDSASVDTYSSSRLYSKEAASDVRAAIEYLARTTAARRFVLLGLCSGAYVAFQSALVEPRVAGLVLVNARRFYWREGDSLEQAMNRVNRSTRAYKRLLFDPKTWQRALRGQVNVRGIAERMRQLLEARVKARLGRMFGRGAEHEANLAHTFRALCGRGVQTLLLYSSDDDGLDYTEVHLGSRGSWLSDVPNFQLRVIEGPDHTFTETWSRDLLSKMIEDHLAKHFR